MPRPLGQAVIDVDDALPIEDVASRPECFGDLALRAEIEQCGEREPHAAAFIGERRAAKRAAHLARGHASGPVERAGVEAEMLDSAGHADVALVEDRGPLHGRTVQCLAGPAVADLRIHRVGADLVVDGAAMAARAVAHDERIVVKRRVVGAEVVHRNTRLWRHGGACGP